MLTFGLVYLLMSEKDTFCEKVFTHLTPGEGDKRLKTVLLKQEKIEK